MKNFSLTICIITVVTMFGIGDFIGCMDDDDDDYDFTPTVTTTPTPTVTPYKKTPTPTVTPA